MGQSYNCPSAREWVTGGMGKNGHCNLPPPPTTTPHHTTPPPPPKKQDKSEGFDRAATGLAILLKLDWNWRFFSPCDLEIWWMTSKIIGHLFCITSSFVPHLKPLGESNWSYCPEKLNLDQNRWFIVSCDLEIWRMTLKNNRAPLLSCFKLCASFHSHQWVQTKVTVRKRSIRVKIGNSLSRVTLKFDEWPWKTIGHLFYVASSFMHHFKAISEFKLKLQSGNAQFRSKSAIFLSCVTLKFDGWPWKTIGHLFYATSSFVHHFLAIGVSKLELQSGIAQFGSKLTMFLAVWPWNLTDDLEKQ